VDSQADSLGDRVDELISRLDLRQTDRHADEATADATDSVRHGGHRPPETETEVEGAHCPVILFMLFQISSTPTHRPSVTFDTC